MQSVSSRIETRVAVSISYDDNHYTTGTSTKQSLINDPGTSHCVMIDKALFDSQTSGLVSQLSQAW